MLSSQHQHHQQFHQFQHQIPTATAALTAFCGAATATDFGSSNNSISSNNAAAATTTAVISSTYEPPSTLAPPQQQQQLIGYGPGLLQQHHPPPISNSRQPQLQQPIQQLMINGGTLAKHHSPTMISSSSATAVSVNGVTAQQPGAWFFPPNLVGGNGQQPHQQQGIMDHLSNGSPPSSPGLMAPHQLLARFGPRHCTESVEVPSSEHVAEIVGRQGCKIKALRAKTNTYIKTPVRGEEPVFVVTGRHEDVAEARREIECAAEHFTQIRASRRHSQGACPAPGHVTAYVRVPLRVVGLVVGPKGNTIKRIQQDTHTYIITPSREREPIFEVTGLPQNVEAARREIENHIYQRTGNMPITDQSASVANYDLHAAALQAQQSALGNHRPNYGALAVSTRNLMLSGGDQGMSPHLFQQQHQPNGCGINFGGGQHEFNNNIGTFRAAGHDYGKMMNFAGGGSERGASSPIQQFAMPNGGGSHVPAASTNNLHMLLNALELENAGQEDKPNSAQIARIASGPQLLRSISNNAGRTKQQLQPTTRLGSSINAGMASAFSPWNSQSAGHGINASTDFAGNGIGPTGGGVDFLDLISSSPSQQLFPSSTGCQSSFSISSGGMVGNGFTGAVPGGAVGIGCGGGLSSVNSSSRDEGLGDSPTNSFGRPHGADAYQYQHLMNIWNDLVDQSPSTNAGGQQKVKSADAQGQEGEQKSTPAKETAETEVASG